MTTPNDQFATFANFQKEALEPIRAVNGFAVDAVERFARQNYAVLGDFINFAVNQFRLPNQATDYNEYLAKQMEQARTFGEQLVRRSQEYVELTSAFQAKAQTTAQAAVQSVVPKAKAA